MSTKAQTNSKKLPHTSCACWNLNPSLSHGSNFIGVATCATPSGARMVILLNLISFQVNRLELLQLTKPVRISHKLSLCLHISQFC